MNITFLIEYDSQIPNGRNRMTNDMSILFEPCIPIDAFSIHPYHWSFELTTQIITQTKYLIRFAMGSLCLHNCNHAELIIPKARRGRIYANFSSPPCADGIYYSKYSAFLSNKYYDSRKKIFAVGDIKNLQCRCVEFASGQFASISDLGELIAVYIRLDQ